MGKKKRRGKQKGLQQEGAEPNDSNTEPITETLPNVDTSNINNNSSNEDTSTPSAIDNKGSLMPLSKEEQKSSLKEQGKELPNPEAETIIPNISEGKSGTETPENVPKIPLVNELQVTEQIASNVIGLKVDNTPDNTVIAEVGNNFSAKKSPLENVADSAGASEVTHQQQIPKEIMISKRSECEPPVSLMQISEGQSSEKNIINVGDQKTLLHSSPESIIPSNNTHQVKSPVLPHEEELKTTDNKTEEKTVDKTIPGEKSEEISVHREEFPTEKYSQNTNIPVKLAPEEPLAKIDEAPSEKKIPEEISVHKEKFPTEKYSQNTNIPVKLAPEESIAKIDEAPSEKKIPGEKSEESSVPKEEFPTEKCSQNTNISMKLAPEKSITKIDEAPSEKKIPGEKSEEISVPKEEFPTEKGSQNTNIPVKLAPEESIAKIDEGPSEEKIPGEKSEEILLLEGEFSTEKTLQNQSIPAKLGLEESITKIEEKSEEKKTPEEKSKEILVCEGEFLTEKCSKNPNIPAKLGSDESNPEVKNIDQIDSRQIAECLISEQTTTQETKVVNESQNLNISCHNNPQKQAKDNLQSQKLLPLEKDESVQHNLEQEALSEGNSNEQIVSSITGTKKSNKKNKKSNFNKSKAKIKEDKPILPSDSCELSKTDDTDQKEGLENQVLGEKPKIIKKSEFKDMEENSTTGEKTETTSYKIQPVEENLKPTGGNIGAVKDQEMNVIPTSEVKPSSPVITEVKDIENIINISPSKGAESNQLKKENNTNAFTNKTDDMKKCSQVCSSSSEEKPDSQTISSSQRKDSEPVVQIQCKEKPEKKTGHQSSELGIHKNVKEDSINPSLKGNNEAGKKQPHSKSNDKSKNIASKNPSHQQKTVTGVNESNTQNQTVLDSFVDTNMNTMLSRNKKGASKQKKNDNKGNLTSNKKAEKNTSDENKYEEVKKSEEVIKEESESGSLQQTMKTISTETKNSTNKTELSHTSENNTNQGNAQESHANLEKEGEGHSLLHTEGRVPARPIFMANTCHICKLTHGGSTRLQTCSACRLITYCSKEHQKKHWKEHKSICKVIQNMVRQRGLTDLFSNAHKITNAEEWRKFRCILLTEAENHVDRALLPYEREMFLYPRTCGKCHRSDPEKLKVCKLCHYMNYCSNEHIASDHHIWCQDLKLLLEINQYQSLYGLIKPFIPNFKLNESKPFPKDMKDFILNYVSREKNFDLFNLYEATLSDVASYPLTVLYAINYLKERNFYTKLSNKLTIHLVGAESQFEADTISKWDAFLINLLPDVVQLDLVFIGPELTPNNTNKMNCENREIKNVKTKDPSKQLVTEFHYGKLYHEYAKEENFSKPDIICAFNCGIYRFTGFNKQDTWGPTMSSMLKYPHTPIILTAYTAVEAPKDVERFQNQFKIEIVHKTARNPFSSMRPNLNFVSDDETPVIYKNQYLSIIMKGD